MCQRVGRNVSKAVAAYRNMSARTNFTDINFVFPHQVTPPHLVEAKRLFLCSACRNLLTTGDGFGEQSHWIRYVHFSYIFLFILGEIAQKERNTEKSSFTQFLCTEFSRKKNEYFLSHYSSTERKIYMTAVWQCISPKFRWCVVSGQFREFQVSWILRMQKRRFECFLFALDTDKQVSFLQQQSMHHLKEETIVFCQRDWLCPL